MCWSLKAFYILPRGVPVNNLRNQSSSEHRLRKAELLIDQAAAILLKVSSPALDYQPEVFHKHSLYFDPGDHIIEINLDDIVRTVHESWY